MTSRIYLLCSLLAVALTAHLGAAEPWGEPFQPGHRAILDAARDVEVPRGEEVVVLLEEHRYQIESDGKMKFAIRVVIRIVEQDAVESWAQVEREYAPWRESKPQIRARVITTDGAVHWLDQKTIADSPAQEYEESIFSDRRVVRAPLPAVTAGSVVEYEISGQETPLLPDTGIARKISIQDHIRVQRLRLSLKVDRRATLHTAVRLIPEPMIRRRTAAGMTEVEFELGPWEPRKEFEFGLPPDVADRPYFAFSTGTGWQQVATRYEEIVDRQIALADVKWLTEGVAKGGGAIATATQLVARLHREVRYTGVEFAEAAIIPRTPDEVRRRKYGDCKDKAALLVAVLRAAGLRAYLALLSAGDEGDVEPELPGLGVFNHAIVYVPDGPLWIDATAADTRVGALPPASQERLALVASRTTTALVRTPASASADNRRIHTIHIRMSELGPAEIDETIEAYGSQETTLRQTYSGNDNKATEEAIERYVKQSHLAKALADFKVPQKNDFSGPFRLTTRAVAAKRAVTELDDAVAVLVPSIVFQEVPFYLLPSDETDKRKPRKHPFAFPEPYIVEYRYRIHPPVLFHHKALPPSVDVAMGPARYSRKFGIASDGTIEATFVFDTGKRRYAAGEFDALRDAIEQHSRPQPELISFVSETSELIALGKTGEALQKMRERLARPDKQPQALGTQLRLVHLLVVVGAVERARAITTKAVESDPSSVAAWRTLAWVNQHDPFGRRFHGNWSRTEAERCYREAIQRDPEDVQARFELASLFEHGRDGRRYGEGAQLADAVELYRGMLKQAPEPAIQQNLAVALMYAGRYDEARKAATEITSADSQLDISVVLTALQEGPARAIIEAQSRVRETRARAIRLMSAALTLMQLRRYDLAKDLIAAAGRASADLHAASRADIFAKVKRHEESLHGASDPRYPVEQVILLAVSGKPEPSKLAPFFMNWEISGARAVTEVAAIRRSILGLETSLRPAGLSGPTIVDLVLSLLELKADGDDETGYRIRVGLPVPQDAGVFYVVRQADGYRILGSARNTALVGRLVLDLLKQQDIKAAQQWLDRTVADLRPDGAEGTGGPAARFLWAGVNEASRGPVVIATAAASLLGRHYRSEEAVQILKDARVKALTDVEKAQIDLALCENLFRIGEWKELLLLARRLAAVKHFDDDAFRFMTKAMTELAQWKELEIEAQRRLQSRPDDSAALRAMATVAFRSGDFSAATQHLKKITFRSVQDDVFAAWNSVLASKPDSTLLVKLTERAQSPILSSPNLWYTVGMLQVALGRPDEARQAMLAALEYESESELDARAWVLATKIFTAYNLLEEAATAHHKALSARQQDEVAGWAEAVIRAQTRNSGSAAPR